MFLRSPGMRILLVLVPLMMGLMTLGYRLYDIQVVRHAEMVKQVSRMHDRVVKLPALRGMVVDCNGNMMAHSVTVRTIALDPEAVREVNSLREKKKLPPITPGLARLIGDRLSLPLAEVEGRLGLQGRYTVLKRKVPDEVARQLQREAQEKKWPGLIFEDDQLRVYPNGSLMSHVIGYVNSQHRGMDGVEFLMQNEMQGQDGWRRIECNRKGEEIVVFRNEDIPARNGHKVMLTLDQTIQDIVERELDQAVQVYRPDNAVVIVMRPSTGEVLAMASRPTFDPNLPEKNVDALRNRAVSDMLEPGSTFKIVTVAAALDQRLVSLDDKIWCENGKFFYGGRYLHDHEPYGFLTVEEGMAKSSNIMMAKLGIMLGDERMHAMMLRLGMGEKCFGNQAGDRWPGEISGVVHPLKNWSKISITRVAMGHEVGVTPLQMANAMCAVANGGSLMRPLMVKKIIDSEGKVVREFFPQVRRRVMDGKAAGSLTKALKQVVGRDGTAVRAAIPGFEVAGKTGTAQKIKDGRYVDDQFVSSFSGYFPAEDPEICIHVMFDNPKGRKYYGGEVAAPVFHQVGVQVASYLNIRPSLAITQESSAGLLKISNSRRRGE